MVRNIKKSQKTRGSISSIDIHQSISIDKSNDNLQGKATTHTWQTDIVGNIVHSSVPHEMKISFGYHRPWLIDHTHTLTIHIGNMCMVNVKTSLRLAFMFVDEPVSLIFFSPILKFNSSWGTRVKPHFLNNNLVALQNINPMHFIVSSIVSVSDDDIAM